MHRAHAAQQFGDERIHHEAEQLWQVLSEAQAGNTQEDSIHGRDKADENEEEDQIHQLGDASPIGATGLNRITSSDCVLFGREGVEPRLHGST